jgi:hypothetical protein
MTNETPKLHIEDGAIKLVSRNIFLRNITSTRINELPPKYVFDPGAMVLLAVIIFASSGSFLIAVVYDLYIFFGVGLIIGIGGGLVSHAKFPRKIIQHYSLIVVTSAGEITALTDLSKEAALAYSDEIARAISSQ